MFPEYSCLDAKYRHDPFGALEQMEEKRRIARKEKAQRFCTQAFVEDESTMILCEIDRVSAYANLVRYDLSQLMATVDRVEQRLAQDFPLNIASEEVSNWN